MLVGNICDLKAHERGLREGQGHHRHRRVRQGYEIEAELLLYLVIQKLDKRFSR